jgi:hypothetical protein
VQTYFPLRVISGSCFTPAYSIITRRRKNLELGFNKLTDGISHIAGCRFGLFDIALNDINPIIYAFVDFVITVSKEPSYEVSTIKKPTTTIRQIVQIQFH